ncbi:MAG: signal peptide peptidase SppA [Halobacteriaceae archaeon]
MNVDSPGARLGRVAVVVAVTAVVAAAGWVLFVRVPGGSLARLLGVVLAVGVLLGGVRLAGSVAQTVFPSYNVAEVGVDGPITRDASRGFPSAPTTPGADDVVEQIRNADDDGNADALLLRLNTPGGEVVPSDDIRDAAEDFEGPTVAYATDVCASGGYWIATGCDRVFAREGSVVGSIGVVGSTVNLSELADDLGVAYERFAAGEFKDAGNALKEMREEDREYLQGIVDDYYERFVERVTEGRDVDAETVRGTEARVYLGEEARELGLVDEVGTREDALDHVEQRLGAPVAVREFEPRRGLRSRIRGGAAAVAYALGAGVADALVEGDDGGRFKLR